MFSYFIYFSFYISLLGNKISIRALSNVFYFRFFSNFFLLLELTKEKRRACFEPLILPKKIEQYSAQKFYFCQTDGKFFFSMKIVESCTSYMLTFESSMVWSKENMEILWKNKQHLCLHSQIDLPLEHAIGDHSKQLRPCI